jgi:hypothetical protein
MSDDNYHTRFSHDENFRNMILNKIRVDNRPHSKVVKGIYTEAEENQENLAHKNPPQCGCFRNNAQGSGGASRDSRWQR